MLWHPKLESCVSGWRAGRLAGQQEQFAFAKGVADLGNRAQRYVLGVGAEIDRNWIEDVAQDARQRQQAHAAAGRQLDAARAQECAHPGFKSPRRAGRKVVRVPKAVEIGAVAAQEARAAVDRLEFVQVGVQHHHAMLEGVGLRPQPPVRDDALIQAGVQAHASSASRRLSCSAEPKASSWKP